MRTCLVLLFALICAPSVAQTITGTVIDKSSGRPIEFASVLLIHLPDSAAVKGTASDKKGKFSIADITPGDYLLRCSFVGFASLETGPFVVKAGSTRASIPAIALVNTSKSLTDVTVVGRRATLNTSIDRKVYNVEQDIMSRSGSASDILKNIPSVEVDVDGNVSLRGSADVMILIDGKPSPLMGRTRAEVLQQLPANSIERIEVITNPSARYRPDGTSGIINIVLKKNIRNGFNGTVTANGGNRDRYNGNISLNYRPRKFNLFSSYSFRHDTRIRHNAIDRSNLDSTNGEPQGFYNQQSGSVTHPRAHIATAGLDFTIDENNSAGMSATYFYRKQVRRDLASNYSYNAQGILTENYDRLRYDPEFEKQKNGTVYYQHRFGREGHELRAEFNTSNEDEVEDNHYTNAYKLPAGPNTFDNTRIAQGTKQDQLTINYANPVSENAKFEAGYDGLYNNVDLNFYGEYYDALQGRFIKDMVKSNRFIYKEDIHALYATWQKSSEKFGYEIGLRGEAAFTKGYLVNLDSFVRNNYFKVYPTVHVSWKLNENSELQLNYSKRVHRAEADELNPFPEYQDPRNIRAGNPKLLPEVIHSIELGYKLQQEHFSFVPSLYYRYKQNGFTSVIVPLNDTTLLTSFQNLSNDQSAGLELIFSARSGKWFSASLNSNVFYNRIDATNLGYIQNRSIVSMSAAFSSNLNLTPGTMLQLSANYRSARLTPQGKTYPSFVMNTGIRQDLLRNKLSVTLTVSDLFSSLRQKSEYDIPTLHQVSVGRRDGRIIYLGLSYRFGVIKKTKEEKIQFDNSL
jgi:outer membrane receptor protein involved in Fe transport